MLNDRSEMAKQKKKIAKKKSLTAQNYEVFE